MVQIGIYVLSEQGYFLVSTRFQILHLCQDAFHIATAFAASGVGNDAIVAEVVATAHDTHKAREAVSVNTFGHHITIGLGGGEFGIDGLVPQFGLRHQVGQRQISIGTGHEVGMVLREQAFLHSLCHAAQHTYDEATLATHGVKCLKAVHDFLFGIVAHGTSIKKHGIGFVHAFARLIISQTHHRRHHFAVGHVHLAAVGFYIEFLHNGHCFFAKQNYEKICILPPKIIE